MVSSRAGTVGYRCCIAGLRLCLIVIELGSFLYLVSYRCRARFSSAILELVLFSCIVLLIELVVSFVEGRTGAV